MYEVQMGNTTTTQSNSNRFNSTVTSAAESKSWWISKTDQDKQEKEKAYKDQLKILKTLTNIDLIKEYQDQSDMFRALSKKSSSSSPNNNTHTWQLNSSTSKLSTHSTKYEISIKLPKNSKQFNFYKNLPMLSLIENVEKILKDWIDIEILNKRLNSKSILNVFKAKLSDNNLIVDFSILAYPKVDVEGFAKDYVLERFGLAAEVRGVMTDPREEDPFLIKMVETEIIGDKNTHRPHGHGSFTSGMKFAIFLTSSLNFSQSFTAWKGKV